METDRVSRLEDYRAGRKDAVESGPRRRRIALSRFCYRRRKTLAPQVPRKLPKLDVAGSTPVAPYSGRKQLGSVDREDCNPFSFGAPLTRMTLTSLPPCRSPNSVRTSRRLGSLCRRMRSLSGSLGTDDRRLDDRC